MVGVHDKSASHHFPALDFAQINYGTNQASEPTACDLHNISAVSLAATSKLFPLSLEPSLNCVQVIGGGNNTNKLGYFSEFEFLEVLLAHCIQLAITKATIAQTPLSAHNTIEIEQLKSLAQLLFQSHMIAHFFQSPNTKHSQHLLQELKAQGSLLIQCRDRSHAFYLEINSRPDLYNLHTSMCDIHMYNTGKGNMFHDGSSKRFIYESILNSHKLLSANKHKKIYSRKTYPAIHLTENKLNTLIYNIDSLHQTKYRPRLAIYSLYCLLSRWSKPNKYKNISQPQSQPEYIYRLQAQQKYRDCQVKSLMAVIKHKLPPKTYLVFKQSLLEHCLANGVKPATKFMKAQAVADIRLQAKLSRVNLKLARLND